jgi:hypothetical protein
VYLAERESMRLYDEPMFYDRLSSMPDGPVASVTLNFMNGENVDNRWSLFVGPRSGFDIPLARREITLDDLDHLSPANVEILSGLWDRFGDYDQFRLRDWTLNPSNIPEWKDPSGSSIPITHSEVFKKLNKTNPADLERDVEEYRALSKILVSSE